MVEPLIDILTLLSYLHIYDIPARSLTAVFLVSSGGQCGDKQNMKISTLGQGLSYRAQFCPVPVTKIWTPYSQTNFFYQYTKTILTSRAFHPCITLGVKDNRKLVEKIFEVKKSPRNGTFCLPLFLVTQVWAVVMAKFAIGSYLSKLPNVLPW